MASAIVSTRVRKAFVIDAETLTTVRHMLLDAIKAASQLDTLTENVRVAAEANYSASVIAKAGMLEAPCDLDVGDLAEMVLLLELLPPAEALGGQQEPVERGVQASGAESNGH